MPRIARYVLVFLVTTLGAVTADVTSTRADMTITVTNSGDAIEGATCPHETLCTLRAALTYAQGQLVESGIIEVQFDPTAFSEAAPATIQVASPLPAVTRGAVVIDASGAGVVLDGSLAATTGTESGITLSGDGSAVLGLTVLNFPATCISISGANARVGSADAPNHVDGCQVGIEIAGTALRVQGNVVGDSNATLLHELETGILVRQADPDSVIGVILVPGEANVLRGGEFGIRLEPGEGGIDGLIIRGNRFGDAGEQVGTGVYIGPPAVRVHVVSNTFVDARTGIAVAGSPVAGEGESTGNTLRANTFAAIEELAIDLGADGVQNVNDEGDVDAGANTLLNHAEIEESVQGTINGKVPGPCSGCTVDLYTATVTAAGASPAQPAGPSVQTGTDGFFSFVTPPVSPGEWVMALVTDPEGNTSEFSPAMRVGAGIVQCSGILLHAGWNSVGYFGPLTALGNRFPADGLMAGAVKSIHQLLAGSRDFRSWYENGVDLSTLHSLSTGDAYWMWSMETVQLAGSFTLSSAAPVELEEGWNEFVYLGAAEEVSIAFSSLQGKFSALYRFDNVAGITDWKHYGGPDTPDWAREFTTVDPCRVYHIHMTEAATLDPLQP